MHPFPHEVFQMYYESWCSKYAPKDRSLLNLEGRDIDLSQLHYEVISAGSYKMVSLS